MGSAVAVGTAASTTASAAPADAVVDADREDEDGYPRCLYKPNDDDEWHPALPINLHARADGSASALEAVEDAFTGLGNLEWTPVFPDATAKAWDPDAEELVSPDASYRRPQLSDGWEHVHVWRVDDDRAAIHAHLDVFDPTSSHFHRGDRYGEAAAAIASYLTGEGWSERTPYEIDYGVEDDRLERWGETGDAKLRY